MVALAADSGLDPGLESLESSSGRSSIMLVAAGVLLALLLLGEDDRG